MTLQQRDAESGSIERRTPENLWRWRLEPGRKFLNMIVGESLQIWGRAGRRREIGRFQGTFLRHVAIFHTGEDQCSLAAYNSFIAQRQFVMLFSYLASRIAQSHCILTAGRTISSYGANGFSTPSYHYRSKHAVLMCRCHKAYEAS